MMLGGLVALGVMAGGASATAAQEESRVLRGRVLADETGRPVAGVQLRFDSGQRTLTDRDGRFRLTGLALGEHRVALVTPLCQVTWGRVVVEDRMSWETELTLPQNMSGFQPPAELRPQGEGVWISASQIEEMRVRSAADVLRRAAPEMVSAAPGQPGRSGRLRGRTRATLTGESLPTVIVDGVRTEAPILWDLDAPDLAAVQILEGVSGGWIYGAPGGVVRVWTKRGGGRASAGTPDACPVPGWEGGRP
jgi:hypothetical protein